MKKFAGTHTQTHTYMDICELIAVARKLHNDKIFFACGICCQLTEVASSRYPRIVQAGICM